MDKLIALYKKYASFQGRATRKEYNLYTLSVIAIILVGFVGMAVLTKLTHSFYLSIAPLVILAVIFVVPNIATQVRRFHDHNMTGWFVLIMPIVLFIIGFIIGFVFGFLHLPPTIAMGLSMVINVAYILFMMAKRGTVGPNKFGNDLLQPELLEVVDA